MLNYIHHHDCKNKIKHHNFFWPLLDLLTTSCIQHRYYWIWSIRLQVSQHHTYFCVCLILIFKVTNTDCIITRFQFDVTFQCCRTCVIGSNYADALTCCYNSSFTFASVSLCVLSSAIYKPMHGNFLYVYMHK